MANNISHFAIQADDVERARAFYAGAFGWQFEAWGPPGFYNIATGDGGIRGALYARTEPNPGAGMRGYRCTIAVDDIDAARVAVLAYGGAVHQETSAVPGVGRLFEFLDSEGNVVCAMQYDAGI